MMAQELSPSSDFVTNPYPYIRIRLYPNNQLIISQSSRRPSAKKATDTTAQKDSTRIAKIISQLIDVDSHLDLCNILGYSVVEIPVACYKLQDESYTSYMARCDFFSKDYLYKVVLPYPDRDGVRDSDFWESDYQVERRQRRRAAEEGQIFLRPDYSDRRRLPIKDFLIARNGYYWDNVTVDRENLLALQQQLKSLLSPPPLDITSDFQECLEAEGHPIPVHPVAKTHHKTLGADYPVTRFNHEARRTMHCAGYIFDQLCQRPDSPPNAVFVTLTLPGSTAEAIRTLAAWSGYISNRLMQVIRDCEKSHKVEIHWLKTWEWQKRGALHLHLVLGADSSVCHNLLLDCAYALKHKWHDILFGFLSLPSPRPAIKFGGRVGCMPVVDMYERGNVKPGQILTWRNHPHEWQDKIVSVEKSVGRYLSKYTGKSKELFGKKPNVLYYPSRWYGFSRILRGLVSQQTIDVRCELSGSAEAAFLTFVENTLSALQPLVVKTGEYLVTKAGRVVSGFERISSHLAHIDSFSSNDLPLLFGRFLNTFSTIPYSDAMGCISCELSLLNETIRSSRYIRQSYCPPLK